MADRYISEKALIENIAKIEDLRTVSTKTIGQAIKNTPTADVVEVKHGFWKRESDDVSYWYVCSECHNDIPRNKYGGGVFHDYCPNCGAKMDSTPQKEG